MLDFIRKKQKSTLVQLVFWAIIATFVGTIFLVWGKGGDDGGTQDNYALKVNGDRVGTEAFQMLYANMYRLYQNVYGNTLTPALEQQLNLRQQALDELINQSLLLQEAKRRKLKVSNKEVIEAIAGVSAFQENGAFSRSRYVQVLRGQRLTPDQFEELQRRELLIGKARKAIEGETSASAAEIEQEYREQNEKVDLALIAVDPVQFESRVKVDATALQNYFAAHKEEFRLPDTVSLQYVVVDPKGFTEQVTVTEADLEKYYQRHLDEFEIPEQVRAAHILIRVPQGASAEVKAAKRASINSLLDRIKRGEDFAALARNSSEDPGSAARGGDLGFFGRGAMVPAFEEAAFALNVGETSAVVETDFGFHVIRVSEHRDAEIKPLAAVREQVQAGVKAEGARALAHEKAMDLYNVNRKGGTLQAVATDLNAQIRETGFFTREQPNIAGFALPQDVADVAFALKDGELGRPVALAQGSGTIIFALKERRAAHVPELGEVRSAVEAAFRKNNARDLAKSTAMQLLAELRQGADVAALAAKHGLSTISTGLFARSRNHFIPTLGVHEELSAEAFTLSSAAPVASKAFEVDGLFVVARLKERRTAEPGGLTAAVRSEMETAVLNRKKQEAVDAALKALRDKAEIVYSPAFAG